MQTRLSLVILLLAIAMPSWAASLAKHTTVKRDAAGNAVEYTEIVADHHGNLRLDTYAIDVGAQAAGGASTAGAAIETTISRGRLNDSVVFQAKEKKVLMLDGAKCRVLGADTQPPPGMPSGGMGQYQEQMKQAQVEMNKAFEGMAKQNPQMAEMLKKRYGGTAQGVPQIKPRNDLTLVKNGQSRTIGQRQTAGFDVVESSSSTKRYTVWAAPIDSVDGGGLVGRGMQGMFGVYQEYMDRIGAGALSNTDLTGVIMSKMRSHYPILTEDHRDNTRTELLSTADGGAADFYPRCNEM